MITSLRLPRPRARNWALGLGLSAGLTLSSCGGDNLKCGGPFCVGPDAPQATTIKKGLGDGQQGAPGQELSQPLEVIVTDNDNQPIQDVEVTFNVGEGGGALSETTLRSDVQGRARVTWTLGTAVGSQGAQASANNDSGSPLSGAPVTFSAQAVRPPASKLVIRQAPSVSARSGVRLDQQPVLDVLDANDAPVPGIQVNASIASGSGTISGTTAVTSDGSGRVTYNDLALAGPSGPSTLRFSVTDPALEVVSGTIILGAGGPARLAGIAPLAYAGTVASPVSPAPSVVVKDAAGNGVPGISVSFTANRDATVSPETVATDENGVAQVTSWTLGSSSTTQYTLTARVEGSALPAVGFIATARAGAAGRLAIVTQPASPTQNGVPFSQQPAIQVTDQDGNPTPQANLQITATISAGPNGALQNATASTDANGRATFNGLTLTGTVGNYTLSFSAEGLTGVTSNPVALTVGAPAQLAVAVAPATTARSRAVLLPQPVIQLQDAGGNVVAQSGVAIGASVDAGTLGGQTTVMTGADGRAAFSGLAIAGSPGLKALTFSSTGLQPASAQVKLPDVASVEVQTAAPASAEVGTMLSSVPVWVLKDIDNNPVADAPFTVGASAGSVMPVSGASGDNGIAQVQTWTLGTISGDQYVEIRVGTALSSQVHTEATATAPDTLRMISGDNQSAPVNSSLPSPLVVRVLDRYGNGVPGASVQWRSCDGSGDYSPTTDNDGFSSANQPTGAQPGPACTQAFSPGVGSVQIVGSPVTFNYTITAGSPMSQSRAGKELLATPHALPPGPPRSPAVRRPASR